ncbi:hypothetical protein AVEN_127211-1 [Araneus ventricosus]|uniref:Uncharacterized protein n=1 Tax=Araneus ventricosus TaxID=182803 RepID=A0A4Y2VPD1_ARAVE|nr:hypothetical protein AVEN_246843-1 [Araneus ventricosus]GBO26481.1 hypothetical protein AVEN_127211-1 [Araneus ventricosus]
MVTIEIYSVNDKKIKKIVWQSPPPSSTRYCRPIKFMSAKETLNVIKTEVKRIKEQVVSLLPTKISINDMEVSVKPTLIFCMIDGKIVMAWLDVNQHRLVTCVVPSLVMKGSSCEKL